MKKLHGHLWTLITIVWVIMTFQAAVYAAQYYRVSNGGNTIVNEWSVSKKVTNACGADIFVPTNSSAEWTAFQNNKPGCATLSNPGTNCTYTAVFQAYDCFYDNQTCTDVCSYGCLAHITAAATGGGTCAVTEGQYLSPTC